MLSNKLMIFLIVYGASLSESSPNPEHCLGANLDLCGSLSRTHPYWTLLTGLSRTSQIYPTVTWLPSQSREFGSLPSKKSDWNSKTFNSKTPFSSEEMKSSLRNIGVPGNGGRAMLLQPEITWLPQNLDFVVVCLIDFLFVCLFFPHSGNNSM